MKIQMTNEEIAKYAVDFHEKTAERIAGTGHQQYGEHKFLRVDTLQEAIEEVLDLANYARFTYIKLRALQAQLDKDSK